MIKKLHVLIFKEILTLSLVIIAAMSAILFMFKILRYGEYLFMSKDGFWTIMNFFVFLFPSIFKVTVPISLLLASVIVAIRMSHDREMDAWMSFGCGMKSISVATIAIGLVMTSISLYFALYLEAFGRKEWLKFRWLHARRSVETIIESKLYEKTFLSELFPLKDAEVSMYVDTLSPSGRKFKDVFVAFKNKNEKFSVVLNAKEGGFDKTMRNGVQDYILRLYDGYFYQPLTADGLSYSALVQKNPNNFVESKMPDADTNYIREQMSKLPAKTFPQASDWMVVQFDEVELSLVSIFQKQLDPGELRRDDIRSKYPLDYASALKEIRKAEDWQKDRNKVRDHTFFYEQIVVPFACLFLPTIGFAMGMQDPRRKAGPVYLFASIVVFTFYALVMLIQDLSVRGWTSPEMTLVFPPLFLAILFGMIFHWRGYYTPTTTVFEYIHALVLKLFRTKKKKSEQ